MNNKRLPFFEIIIKSGYKIFLLVASIYFAIYYMFFVKMIPDFEIKDIFIFICITTIFFLCFIFFLIILFFIGFLIYLLIYNSFIFLLKKYNVKAYKKNKIINKFIIKYLLKVNFYISLILLLVFILLFYIYLNILQIIFLLLLSFFIFIFTTYCIYDYFNENDYTFYFYVLIPSLLIYALILLTKFIPIIPDIFIKSTQLINLNIENTTIKLKDSYINMLDKKIVEKFCKKEEGVYKCDNVNILSNGIGSSTIIDFINTEIDNKAYRYKYKIPNKYINIEIKEEIEK